MKESFSYSHRLRPPYQYLKLSREMEQRLGRRQLDPRGRGHGIAFDLGLSILQGPRQVVDIGARKLLTAHCVQAVTLRQEVLERSLFPYPRLRDGPIAAVILRGARILEPAAGVLVVLS